MPTAATSAIAPSAIAPRPAPPVTIRLTIPAELYAEIDQMAQAAGAGSFEELLIGAAAVGLAAQSAAYLIDQPTDKELRRLLGGRVDSGPKLLDMVRRLTAVRIGGYRVELRPSLQEAIFWACKSLGREPAEAAPQLILDAVAEKFRT